MIRNSNMSRMQKRSTVKLNPMLLFHKIYCKCKIPVNFQLRMD